MHKLYSLLLKFYKCIYIHNLKELHTNISTANTLQTEYTLLIQIISEIDFG